MIREQLTNWLEIDLDALSNNVKQIRAHLAENCRLLAVIKNDAYGLGAPEVAQHLVDQVDYLAVSTLQEALTVRDAGVTLPILVFIPPLRGQVELFVKYNLTAALDSKQTLEVLRGNGLSVHLKVNTGMNRLGLAAAEVAETAEQAQADGLIITGIYSHFAAAADKSCAQKQLTLFKQVLTEVDDKNINRGLAHIANSAAIVNLPEAHLDMVRAGTLLYGQSPVTPPADFAPAETFCAFARIVAVHDLAAGEKIGYGGDYTVKAPLRAAVVAAGYGDGFCLEPQSRQGKGDIVRAAIKNSARALGNKPRYYFMAGNKRLPLLGRVAMQMSCCDISGTDLKVGDIVRLPLRRTCASALLPRLYLQGGKIVACRGFSEDK